MTLQESSFNSKASTRFYSQDSSQLKEQLHNFFDQAELSASPFRVKAIIAPHAGYSYSGLSAAKAYKQLVPQKSQVKRVVLFGPSHKHPFNGVALPSAVRWVTPIGGVDIDAQNSASLVEEHDFLSINDKAHEDEYSLDVQLPFLQTVLDEFVLLPFSVGNVSSSDLSKLIAPFWDDENTIVVISTDLSHFLDDSKARVKDEYTAQLINSFRSTGIDASAACGFRGLSGLLNFANNKNVVIEQTDLCNSSDTIGSKDKVVGYGSWVLRQRKLNDDELIIREFGSILLNTASEVIKRYLKTGRVATVSVKKSPEKLQPKRATFVTIEQDGRLRGCIGSLSAQRPLVSDVMYNACAAAFNDKRFEPLKESDLANLMISISLLSPLTRIEFSNEADLVNLLEPHKDGLLIQDSLHRKDANYRAVFLPQVWNSIPEPEQFLQHLKAKAGMKRDYWSSDVIAWKFSVVKTSSFFK